MKTTKYFQLLIIALICIGTILLYEQGMEKKEFLRSLTMENQSADFKQRKENNTQESSLPEILSDYEKIRVLITDSNDETYEHTVLQVYSTAPILVSGAYNVTIPANVTWDVGEILATGEEIQLQSAQEGIGITITSLEKSGKNPTYEGILEISCQDGKFKLINELALETYLKYVVPSEMPSSYPIEALKAQAVCARTYAIRHISKESLQAYDADVDDTVNFQVYAHISSSDSTNQAVNETKGKIIAYEGMPIEAYFFSTSCGFTSGIEVWGGDESIPYLHAISVSDLFAQETEVFSYTTGILSESAFIYHLQTLPNHDLERSEAWYRWNITFPWEEINRRVAQQYPEIGTLQSIKVQERSSGGAILLLELQGSLGTTYIKNEYNVREFFSPQNQTVILNNGTEAPKQKLLPSAYFYYTIIEENDIPMYLQLHGGGYGHGVGLSQNGAKHMAQKGLGYEQIIQRFYRNVEIIDIN